MMEREERQILFQIKMTNIIKKSVKIFNNQKRANMKL